jgi:hypothetical protein
LPFLACEIAIGDLSGAAFPLSASLLYPVAMVRPSGLKATQFTLPFMTTNGSLNTRLRANVSKSTTPPRPALFVSAAALHLPSGLKATSVTSTGQDPQRSHCLHYCGSGRGLPWRHHQRTYPSCGRTRGTRYGEAPSEPSLEQKARQEARPPGPIVAFHPRAVSLREQARSLANREYANFIPPDRLLSVRTLPNEARLVEPGHVDCDTQQGNQELSQPRVFQGAGLPGCAKTRRKSA